MGKMRLARNKRKRMIKTAGRWKYRQAPGEGLSCPICSPKPYSVMNKRNAQDRAALEEIQESYLQPLRTSPMVGETRE